MDNVILVNDLDVEIGTMEKLEAHELGLLHRAFSVFVFNSKNELLIHKRADSKYHSGGLWTNSCCSHPKPNELTDSAVIRRTYEEIGINLVSVQHVGFILYKAELDGDLIEHEYDHIYSSISDEVPVLNPDEVSDFEYKTLDSIKAKMKKQPELFTFWFKKILLEGSYF